jgi:hypothetical protein
MQGENSLGSVNCFELHPNLLGYADQTTPKEAALLLCCVSRGARYILFFGAVRDHCELSSDNAASKFVQSIGSTYASANTSYSQGPFLNRQYISNPPPPPPPPPMAAASNPPPNEVQHQQLKEGKKGKRRWDE